jgi:hypothetical protein
MIRRFCRYDVADPAESKGNSFPGQSGAVILSRSGVHEQVSEAGIRGVPAIFSEHISLFRKMIFSVPCFFIVSNKKVFE